MTPATSRAPKPTAEQIAAWVETDMKTTLNPTDPEALRDALTRFEMLTPEQHARAIEWLEELYYDPTHPDCADHLLLALSHFENT